MHLYNGVEKLVHAFASTTNGRNDWSAEKTAKLFYIKFVATCPEFIKHVQSYNHRNVHVEQLGGQVQVAFQIGGVNHIDDYIGSLVDDVTAYI